MNEWMNEYLCISVQNCSDKLFFSHNYLAVPDYNYGFEK